MRRALLAGSLLALLMLPLTASAYQAEEVEAGADVALYVRYEGGTTGHRAGTLTEEDSTQQTSAQTTSHVSWEGVFEIRNGGGGRPMMSQLLTHAALSATRTSSDSYSSPSASSESEETCSVTASKFISPSVTALPEPDGLRVTIRVDVPSSYHYDEEGCEYRSVTTYPQQGSSTQEGKRDFQPTIPVVHTLAPGGDAVTANLTIFVPYDGRATETYGGSWRIPHGFESPAFHYCAMPASDSDDWAPGACSASGKLTATALVDPCGAIVRFYKEHYAELAALPAIPAGATEQDIRAWSERAGAAVRAVIGDQRNWALFCSGDLQPDPFEAILRVMTMQRDALLELGQKDKLSDEGIRELVSAERQLQMMGGEPSSFDAVPAIQRGLGISQGTMTGKVHSPVSLHFYDEQGRHVGWNATTNATEALIPGSTYEGEPGGAQTITLPAGYYKVVVDELEAGQYLLEIETNGTGADTVESFLADSIPGRTTSSHYAVTEGWDGVRLDKFPMRRVDTPAAFTFRDEGRPSMTGGATPEQGNPRDAPSTGVAGDAASGKGIPAPALGLVLAAFGAAAWRRR